MADHVCPVWIGWFLLNPARKFLQNPRKMFAPHVTPGMTVLDVGCAMGFFTVPLARMVGAEGRVIGVDLQEGMIRVLQRRAAKARLADRIETRLCRADSLDLEDLEGAVDLAVAVAVVHEVPDPARFFAELRSALRPGGRLYLAEPRGHVSVEDFEGTLTVAGEQGLVTRERIRSFSGPSALLEAAGTGT